MPPTKTSPKATTPAQLADGVEGVATFASRAGVSYRYRVVAEHDKLRIWLEDRSSKKQWQSDDLEMKAFVQTDCVIPHATFSDYVTCFLNCLESEPSSDDFSRELVAATSDANAWTLRLTLKLRAFMTTWTPTYAFLLKPVPLELVDLLAAKIRDQEEVIEKLQGQVGELTAKLEAPQATSPVYLRATTTTNATNGQSLKWQKDDATSDTQDAIQVQASGVIRFTTAGTFVVNVMVQHINNNNGLAFDVQVNGQTVVSCIDSNANGYNQTVTVCHVLATKRNDSVTVVYHGNSYAYASSSIVIYQLG